MCDGGGRGALRDGTQTPVSTVRALEPGRSLGRFVLVRRIAAGATAQVWTARDGRRQVALKILRPELARDPSFEASYRSELETARGLDHPGIARISALHAVDGHLFVSMEEVDGLDLRRVLSQLARRGERFPVPLALYVAREVAVALEHAHGSCGSGDRRRPVVHGAVSLHHILLMRDGGTKVIDFGVARAREAARRSGAGRARGPAACAVPERARRAAATVASDVFALAVVLWEVLAMRRLFTAGTGERPTACGKSVRIRPILEVNPSVPAAADALLQGMLSSRAPDRPRRMADVQRALGRILRDHYPPQAAARTVLEARVRPLLSPPIPREGYPGAVPRAPGRVRGTRGEGPGWAGPDTGVGTGVGTGGAGRPSLGVGHRATPTTEPAGVFRTGHPGFAVGASQVVTVTGVRNPAGTGMPSPRPPGRVTGAAASPGASKDGERSVFHVLPALLTVVLAVAFAVLLYFLVHS